MKNPLETIESLVESVFGAITPDQHKRVIKHSEAYRSFRAKALSQRSLIERLADSITSVFGNIGFAIFHVIWFGTWLAVNLGLIPQIPAFDPFPFGLLTMIVSLEAIFLSVFVLISQNRESQVSDLRDEVDFQITMQAEQEITKLLSLVTEIHDHLGIIGKHDPELEKMMQKLDPNKLEKEIVAEVDGSDHKIL
ncbi:MAG: DUF1003 domain-containing protein [Patescibacteria group bacterium]|jgi:uncharacterized membrane protein